MTKRIKRKRVRHPRRQPVAVRKRKQLEGTILSQVARLIIGAAHRGYRIVNLEPVTSAAPGGTYRTDLVLMCSRVPEERFIPRDKIVVPGISVPPNLKGRPQ